MDQQTAPRAASGERSGGGHPATMRAVRFHGGPDPLRLDRVPRPVPGPGEVLVDVAACGLCASDVHFLEDVPVPSALPRTLGHEPAGTVAEVGTDVDDWTPGDRVAIHLGAGCGECRTCRAGAPEACPNQLAPGLHIDGAYADALVVPAAALVSVPDGLSLAAAAVTTDCVASPYHALTCRGRLRPGEQVVVIGVGGLGSMAVAIARHLGAERIVAVDRSTVALERARSLGADAVVEVPADADATSVMGEVRASLDGGAEVVLECVGRPETTTLGSWCLMPGGRLVLLGVGMAPPPIPFPQALFAVAEHSVIGSFASHREDVVAVMELASTGVLDLDAAITHRIGIEEVPAGLDQLRHHRGDPWRIVMVNP